VASIAQDWAGRFLVGSHRKVSGRRGVEDLRSASGRRVAAQGPVRGWRRPSAPRQDRESAPVGVSTRASVHARRCPGRGSATTAHVGCATRPGIGLSSTPWWAEV